jgi:hypothetical protein
MHVTFGCGPLDVRLTAKKNRIENRDLIFSVSLGHVPDPPGDCITAEPQQIVSI